jgi:hypothetical protein
MGVNISKPKKTKIVHPSSAPDLTTPVTPDTALNLTEEVGALEPLPLRDCHGELVVRKPTPYGKTSLESIRRVVSVVNSSTPSSDPNTSMITNTSHSSGLEVCPSKDVLTLSSSSSDSDSA